MIVAPASPDGCMHNVRYRCTICTEPHKANDFAYALAAVDKPALNKLGEKVAEWVNQLGDADSVAPFSFPALESLIAHLDAQLGGIALRVGLELPIGVASWNGKVSSSCKLFLEANAPLDGRIVYGIAAILGRGQSEVASQQGIGVRCSQTYCHCASRCSLYQGIQLTPAYGDTWDAQQLEILFFRLNEVFPDGLPGTYALDMSDGDRYVEFWNYDASTPQWAKEATALMESLGYRVNQVQCLKDLILYDRYNDFIETLKQEFGVTEAHISSIVSAMDQATRKVYNSGG